MSVKTHMLLVAALSLLLPAAARSDEEATASKDEAALIEHGNYIVHNVAMCVQCHSPRDEKGDLVLHQELKGATMPVQSPFRYQTWAFRAPPLAGLPVGYSEQDVVNLLSQGKTRNGVPPRHPMPPYRMNQKDARAVAAYLKSTAASAGAKDAPLVQAEPLRAVAVLRDMKGGPCAGVVLLTEEGDGLRIRADVVGLSPGLHGFAVHAGKDCGEAGEHFNPDGRKHGAPDDEERHAGDLGNLIADESGRVHYERLDMGLKLAGDRSIIGLTIAVKSKWDDLKTDPDGNAGETIACGVIQKMQ
jgi:Cu-Zn family superoxide dismutase